MLIWIAAGVWVVPVMAAGMPVGDGAIESHPNDAVWLVVYILLALIFSFLCSIAEAVLLSVTPSFIESRQKSHPGEAALLKKLKLQNIDRSLAAILTLNTIAHTVGAIGSGAKATSVFGSAWFGVFSAVMTLMILFLSEIVPKTLGALFWKQLAGVTALFVQFLIFSLYPVVWVSEKLTTLISRNKEAHLFNRDELLALTRLGEKGGNVANREARILTNLLGLGQRKTTDIMTPRTVLHALPESMSIDDSLDIVVEKKFSRIPIYGESIDQITGFVLRDDILECNTQSEDSKQTLESLKRDILIVPESKDLLSLLERLILDNRHIAVVVDEFGGTDGIVTLEDLIETLFGAEIMDEMDTVEDMRKLASDQQQNKETER
jgi:CBS domain containing-hemolysin-like protein